LGPVRLGFARLAAITVLSLSWAFASHAGDSPEIVRVPDGTPVQLSLTETLSSRLNQPDDPVHFKVSEPVVVRGITVIPYGSVAIGHVLSVRSQGRMDRPGEVSFALDFVKAPDGSTVPLRAKSLWRGETHTTNSAVGDVVQTPLRLLHRGHSAVIPPGAQFTAYVHGDREVALRTAAAEAAAAANNRTPATSAPSEDQAGVSAQAAAPSVPAAAAPEPSHPSVTAQTPVGPEQQLNATTAPAAGQPGAVSVPAEPQPPPEPAPSTPAQAGDVKPQTVPVPSTPAAPPEAVPVPAPAAPQPAEPDPGALGTVLLRSTPSGARILLDGKPAGITPATLQLSPGDHRLVLKQPNYKVWQRTITAEPGATDTVFAALDKLQ
jgi:hypothetical protein